jgi:dTDP-4-dehydrorhamnose 3,5-epimerase
MIFEPVALAGAYLIKLEPHGDERGSFARTMCSKEFAEHGMDFSFVQQNMSVTQFAGTIRGMHYQKPPHSEAKLIRCVRGAVLDVIVDLRAGSPTYMEHASFRLDDENRHQLYIPTGFAHGFQTLADDVEMTYLMSKAHAPGTEAGLRYDDPVLGIDWPLPVAVIADKDLRWPLLRSSGAAIDIVQATVAFEPSLGGAING